MDALLELLRHAGLPVPSSCTAGTAGHGLHVDVAIHRQRATCDDLRQAGRVPGRASPGAIAAIVIEEHGTIGVLPGLPPRLSYTETRACSTTSETRSR